MINKYIDCSNCVNGALLGTKRYSKFSDVVVHFDKCPTCGRNIYQEMILTIKKAIKNNLMLQFDYVSSKMEITFGRKIKPNELKEPYLFGFDIIKKVKRQFHLSGIQELKII